MLGGETFNRAKEGLGIRRIDESYGQTECNLVPSNRGVVMPAKPGPMGRPVPGHRIAVVDGARGELPAGEVGEVAVLRPDPVTMPGCRNNEEATEKKFVREPPMTPSGRIQRKVLRRQQASKAAKR